MSQREVIWLNLLDDGRYLSQLVRGLNSQWDVIFTSDVLGQHGLLPHLFLTLEYPE